MNAIVTGAAGFIGSALLRRLNMFGGTSIGVDITRGAGITQCDLLDRWWISSIIQQQKPDVIFHLASVTTTSVAKENPHYCFSLNTQATVNVLEAARVCGVEKVLIASTYLSPTEPYAASKACAEIIANCFESTYGIKVRIIRCSSVYGPGDKTLTRIIPSIISKAIRKETIRISDAKRDFVFIDDVVNAYIIVAGGKSDNRVFNVADGILIPISFLPNLIFPLTGETKIETMKDLSNEATVMDTANTKALGWSVQTPLSDGIKATVEWLKNELTTRP